MAEICAHIKVTEGCALYCYGGLHTRETLAICIEEIIQGYKIIIVFGSACYYGKSWITGKCDGPLD